VDLTRHGRRTAVTNLRALARRVWHRGPFGWAVLDERSVSRAAALPARRVGPRIGRPISTDGPDHQAPAPESSE
jgi:hypothetical protein